ncbi:MAG TPA: hypothetical protein VEB59_12930 [Gemmatimonadales bacterium]|nr:hypothetical protein [Gemmatimonadales bacterium]
MGTFSRAVRVAVALAVFGGGSVSAQDAPRGLSVVSDGERGGFWMGLGLGAGGESYDLRDGAGYRDELYRPTVSFRLGGTPSQQLRLGGEVLAWFNDEGLAVESLTSLLFVGQLYPSKRGGFYLKGGLGLGRNAVDFDDGYNVGDTGLAGLIGAGSEVRVGRRLYLNPAVDLVEHRYTSGGGDGYDYRNRLVNFGLGITFQSGR